MTAWYSPCHPFTLSFALAVPQIVSNNRLVLGDAEVVEVVDDDGVGEDGLGFGHDTVQRSCVADGADEAELGAAVR